MQPLSVIGLFCEDIREEKSGSISLVGIMPDNVRLAEALTQGAQIVALPRIAAYLRIHFDPNQTPSDVKFDLILPDGREVSAGPVEQHVFDAASADAKRLNTPIAAVTSRVKISPLPLRSLGRLIAQVTIGHQKIIAASVNFTTEDIVGSGVETSHELRQRV